ncbi:MAG: Mur ligase family protein [Patescibacteria group bacterium]|nr:Mur ligase family protein [Patescibacteria group bacterium]
MKKIVEKILKNLAKKVLSNSKLDIIGITGSAGKSSAKEAVFKVLNDSKKYQGQVKKSEGNLNTEIGLPLAILGFKKSPVVFAWPFVLIAAFFRANIPSLNPLAHSSILILEYAADKPGDIEYLLTIAKPKIAVITAIGAAHTQFFKSIDNVAKEKRYLIESLPKDGMGIIGKNNPYNKIIATKSQAKISNFDDQSLEPYKEIAKLIGKIYHLSEKEMNKALENYQSLSGRSNIIKGIKNTTIIDDTYNANPLSMKLAFKKIKNLKLKIKNSRTIIVLGDMRELGDLSGNAHAEIYHQAKEIADILITVGPEFKKISEENNFKDSFEAGYYLLSKLENRDIILVKGSRAMEMERVVEKVAKQ